MSEKDKLHDFKAIYMRYYAKIRNFVFRITKSEWLAEDITQNVFVKLWTQYDKIRHNRDETFKLDSYLFAIAKNEVIDYFRSLKNAPNAQNIKTQTNEETEFLDAETEIEGSIDAQAAKELIENIIMTMPEMRRKIFLMSRRDQLSNDEIAIKLGISKRTVEKHISNGIAQIKKGIIMLTSVIFAIIVIY